MKKKIGDWIWKHSDGLVLGCILVAFFIVLCVVAVHGPYTARAATRTMLFTTDSAVAPAQIFMIDSIVERDGDTASSTQAGARVPVVINKTVIYCHSTDGVSPDIDVVLGQGYAGPLQILKNTPMAVVPVVRN